MENFHFLWSVRMTKIIYRLSLNIFSIYDIRNRETFDARLVKSASDGVLTNFAKFNSDTGVFL